MTRDCDRLAIIRDSVFISKSIECNIFQFRKYVRFFVRIGVELRVRYDKIDCHSFHKKKNNKDLFVDSIRSLTTTHWMQSQHFGVDFSHESTTKMPILLRSHFTTLLCVHSFSFICVLHHDEIRRICWANEKEKWKKWKECNDCVNLTFWLFVFV